MKQLLLTIYLLTIPTCALAAPPTRVNTYTNGTTIRSNDVTQNEDEIFEYLSLGVDTIRADGLDAIGEIKSTLRTGSDSQVVTGTAGSNTEFAIWNSDGDAVSAGSTLTWDSTNKMIQVDIGTGSSGVEVNGSTGGCLMIRDTDDAGWTECFALNGTMSCTTDADGVCDGS